MLWAVKGDEEREGVRRVGGKKMKRRNAEETGKVKSIYNSREGKDEEKKRGEKKRYKSWGRKAKRDAEEGKERAQKEGKDKNGEREGSGRSRGVNPVSVWPAIIYANIITSPASPSDKHRG